MVIHAFLVTAAIFCAVQAVRAERLLISALWLAGVSATLALVFYLLGAYQVAVIELSVGAGLVTVLFVFAISVAGEEAVSRRPLLPRSLAWGLVLLAVLLLGWLLLPLETREAPEAEPAFTTVLWQQRGLDVLVQVVLIFAGVLGLLGLLAEAKAPLEPTLAEEVMARRDRELLALQQQALGMDGEEVPEEQEEQERELT